MEQVFKKQGSYIRAVKRNMTLLMALIYAIGWAWMKCTGWVILPSVMIGTTGGLMVRIIQLSSPVRIRDGRLIQRTANLNWFETVDLSKVTKMEILPAADAKAARKGMFYPNAGIILYYNRFDQLQVECESKDLLRALESAAPQAEVAYL